MDKVKEAFDHPLVKLYGQEIERVLGFLSCPSRSFEELKISVRLQIGQAKDLLDQRRLHAFVHSVSV